MPARPAVPTRVSLVRLCAVVAIPLGVAGVFGLTAQPTQASAPTATSEANCPPLLNHTFDRLQDEKPQSLCQYQGQVLLVVNTASYCGFTSQYRGLEDLHRRYRDRGLVVLGFPSGDFNQEKTDNQAIADFCENTFGIQFPMFGISSVRGPNASPFFQQLAQQSGVTPRWNFYKYLIGRDGQVVAAYSSMTAPSDRRLVSAIQAQLARPAP